jgi:hypothetical protein
LANTSDGNTESRKAFRAKNSTAIYSFASSLFHRPFTRQIGVRWAHGHTFGRRANRAIDAHWYTRQTKKRPIPGMTGSA